MKIGSVDLDVKLKDKPFKWFKAFYNHVLKGRINESPEEVYLKLGGKLPASRKKTKTKGAD